MERFLQNRILYTNNMKIRDYVNGWPIFANFNIRVILRPGQIVKTGHDKILR